MFVLALRRATESDILLIAGARPSDTLSQPEPSLHPDA